MTDSASVIAFAVIVSLCFSLVSIQANPVAAAPEVPEGDFYVHSTSSLIVEAPAVVLAHASEHAYNEDASELVLLEVKYEAGERPPVIAVEEIGAGRLVASGGGATIHGKYAEQEAVYRGMELSLYIVDWLDKDDGKRVLYFYKEGDFMTPERLSTWLAELEVSGYTVDTTNGIITSELLAGYDVLYSMNFGKAELTADELTAIKEWVLAGGGYYITIQSDYGAYGAPGPSNAVLKALGSGIRFQDDQVVDNVLNADGNFWRPIIYLVNHLMWLPPYKISASVSPAVKSGSPGAELTYTVTVANTGGEDDTYTLGVSGTLDWEITVSPKTLTVGAGQSDTATVKVMVPADAQVGTLNIVTVSVTSANSSAGTSFKSAVLEPSVEPEPEPADASLLIVLVVVIVAIIAGAAYYYLKRK